MTTASRFVKYLIKFRYGVYFRIICVLFIERARMAQTKCEYRERNRRKPVTINGNEMDV